MSTPHNEANLGDIAKTVIMPGDPLRAKYIAENFMTDIKLVNSVRGIYAYTGKYKGQQGSTGSIVYLDVENNIFPQIV